MHKRFVYVLTFLFIFSTIALRSQTPTGTLEGTVFDASGSSVPNAAVHVTNTATNESKESRTDNAGRFTVPFLAPGSYTVRVEATGFRPTEETGLVIEVSQNRSIRFTLEVGSVSESVAVTATAAALDTESATLGTVIDNHKVVDLPLNGRNPFSLESLVPGVNNVGNASTPHIGGSRNAVNEQQLDGISNILPENNVGNNVSAYTPIVDSVQEFSVQTNSLSAEYGRFGGGVINLVTKAGTNQYHGSAFDFERSGVLDANDFFANRNGNARPDLHRHQYGGTLGCAGINRHEVGNERVLQERRKRIHPDREFCAGRREAAREA